MVNNEKLILSSMSLGDFENTIRTVLVQTLSEIQGNKPQPKSEIKYLTVKEVSKLLGVSEVTIHQWKKDGKLKFHRFGSRIRFIESEVLNLEKYKPSK